jgi:hypothetical protein
MSDIVERLRNYESTYNVYDDAADEIDRLREALREITEGDRPDNDKQFHVGYWGAKARAALGEGKE